MIDDEKIAKPKNRRRGKTNMNVVGREIEYEIWAVYPDDSNELIFGNGQTERGYVALMRDGLQEAAKAAGLDARYRLIKKTTTWEEVDDK